MAHDGTDKHSLTDLLDMPLAFLGFALWLAWVSLTYANPSVPMPVSGTAGQFAYDVVLAGSAIVIALLSSRIAPLAGRRWVYGAIALLLGFSVAANVAALALPATTDALVAPATLAGGIGSALLILLWCEIYSCLSPTRVALYYALAIISGVVLTFVLQGFRASAMSTFTGLCSYCQRFRRPWPIAPTDSTSRQKIGPSPPTAGSFPGSSSLSSPSLSWWPATARLTFAAPIPCWSAPIPP